MKHFCFLFALLACSAFGEGIAPKAPALLGSSPTVVNPAAGERVVMWAIWAEARDWTVTGIPDYIYPCIFDVTIDGETYTLTVGPFEGSERGATTADYGTNTLTFPSGSGVPVWADSRGGYGIVQLDNRSATPGLAYDYVFARGMSRTNGVEDRPNTRLRFHWPDDNVKLDGVVERINADGTQVLSTGTYHGRRFGVGGGLSEFAKVTWTKNGQRIVRHDRFAGESPDWFDIPSFSDADRGTYTMRVENSLGSIEVSFHIGEGTGPVFTVQPLSQSATAGSAVTLTVAASGATSYRWQRNGRDVPGATGPVLVLSNLQPINTGVYTAIAVNAAGVSVTSNAAIVGVNTAAKVIGAGVQLDPHDIRHPNGNIFDQVLLTGEAETITADYEQITRTSLLDVDDDIVQVEMSGPGSLSLVLDSASGPALPAKYNQAVNYMKGHGGIVITGATENTNVSVFSVGKATAVNGGLFKAGVSYDGIADIAFVAISSTNGKFGGVRTANTHYFAARGIAGIYAPGVEFVGPVYIGNVSAFDTAVPVIRLGSSRNGVQITGGDLFQDNGKAVDVSGISLMQFTDGSDSHGNKLGAKVNCAVLMQAGTDVTGQIVKKL